MTNPRAPHWMRQVAAERRKRAAAEKLLEAAERRLKNKSPQQRPKGRFRSQSEEAAGAVP